jgi:hypothetical protein
MFNIYMVDVYVNSPADNFHILLYQVIYMWIIVTFCCIKDFTCGSLSHSAVLRNKHVDQ